MEYYGQKNEKINDYKAFVEKFKPKKTTDDCYTPPEVYDVVLEHVRAEYGIPEDAPIVRPFYPSGDYEHYEYPEGCVVVYNPPFSILAKILDFYRVRNIRFFLFSPALTSISNVAKREGLLLSMQIHRLNMPTGQLSIRDSSPIYHTS